jgi:pimeloyl-ACP methyl ester carboxylesterase
MPSISIEGQPLRYQDHGAGFPVLLAHSYLWNSDMWAPQIPTLAKSYRVVAPDLWGHGESGRLPSDARTPADLARHASHLLDSLGIEKCAVVGSSVGGMWGAELAMAEPSRVSCLVMLDTFLGAEPTTTRERYFTILDEMASLGTISPLLLDTIVPLFFKKNAALDGELPLRMRQTLSNFSAAQLRESVVPMGRLIFGRPDALPRLSSLDADRTLLMCGVDDIPRPPEETKQMAKLIGCSYLLVPDAGHLPNLENPDFVTGALLDWLDAKTVRR